MMKGFAGSRGGGGGGGGHTLNLKMVMSLFNWKLICLITCLYDAHVQYDKNKAILFQQYLLCLVL